MKQDESSRLQPGLQPGPVARFAQELADLRERHGSPSFARMHEQIRHQPGVAGSKNTFHRMITAPDRIYEPPFVRGFVLALGLTEEDAASWEARRDRAVTELQENRNAGQTSPAAEATPLASPGITRPRSVLLAVITGGVVLSAIALAIIAAGGHATPKNPGSRGTLVVPSPVHTRGAILGPIDVQAACDRQYGPGRIARPADPRNAYTWQCFRPGETARNQDEGVELSIQCDAQYGPNTTARALYSDRPQSWICYQSA